MKKAKVNEKILKKELKPLMTYKKWIESIYVYGSAVTKKSAHDIDTLIILNDSGPEPPKQIVEAIEKECSNITEKASEKGLNFHFQPLKLLSRWWNSLLEGVPWIVSSLSAVIIVYDKKGLIREASRLVRSEKLFKIEEKADKLIESSDLTTLKNRHLLLNSLATLSEAATEAAQILLLFDNKLILNKKKIASELEENYAKAIGDEIIGNYKEIIDLEDKMEKGALSEFSAENLDYYLDKMKKFIATVEAMLSRK